MIPRLIAIACLCLMTHASAWAHRVSVWVVAGEGVAAQRELIDTLRSELDRDPGEIHWSILTPKQFAAANGAPELVVAVGSVAFARVAVGKPGLAHVPVLATMLPRQAYQREQQRAGMAMRSTAIYLDQPLARQAALIRLALPGAQRVGVLLGPDSRQGERELDAALSSRKLSLIAEDTTVRGQFAALQRILDEADVLLALADPAVFNSETIATILAAGYRRNVPLVAFSPAYVRAGALLGLYSTPAQVGVTSAEVVRAVISGKPLPAPMAARDFVVEVNAAVAKSLGVVLGTEAVQSALRAQERLP